MKKFFEQLKEERTSYKDMIGFCCDSMILNNDIIPELSKKDFYFDIFCGEDYDEENETYFDVFQYFIIDSSAAERLERYTNELVYCCEDLDLYILGVCHYGTGWDSVSANWKDEIED